MAPLPKTAYSYAAIYVNPFIAHFSQQLPQIWNQSWQFAGFPDGSEAPSVDSVRSQKSCRQPTGMGWILPFKKHWDLKDLKTNYLGGSKNRGTPKWMVYNGKPY